MGELIRNARVQEALDVWATTKDNRTFSDVPRRAVTGELVLDISTSQIANRAAGPQPGDTIAIASQTDNAGKRLLLAFTDHDRRAARAPETSLSLGQPAHAVLEQAVREYEGIVLDAGHPGLFIAYAPEIAQGLEDGHAGAMINPAGPATVLLPPILAEYAGDAPSPGSTAG